MSPGRTRPITILEKKMKVSKIMITWTSFFHFYEVWRVFLLYALPSLPMGLIPLEWWRHLIHLTATWLADLVEYFSFPLISFQPFGLLISNQILVSTHAPQFWDKMILFQNYFLWPLHVPLFQPPAMIFGPFVDPFHRPFLIKDISKIMTFGYPMALILLTFQAILLPFRLVLIVNLLSSPEFSWYLFYKLFYPCRLLHRWLAFWIDHLFKLGPSANRLNS